MRAIMAAEVLTLTQRERMLAGELYKCDDELNSAQADCREKLARLNAMGDFDESGRAELMAGLFGHAGRGAHINAPFRCDYGVNIYVGDGFYANYNCTMLDVAPIRIGDRVKFGPNVTLTTATHPLDSAERASGYEYGRPITIGDDVWLGANVVVNPGVTIGAGSVIGSGSVVTRDIPANVVAAGVPCRVMRAITEADRMGLPDERE